MRNGRRRPDKRRGEGKSLTNGTNLINMGNAYGAWRSLDATKRVMKVSSQRCQEYFKDGTRERNRIGSELIMKGDVERMEGKKESPKSRELTG